MALQELGPDYTFKTGLFGEGFKAGHLKRLYVKGGGDPALTTEKAFSIARELRLRGVKKIDELALDDSLFLEQQVAAGQRAYETGSSALAFNYNSVDFRICPRSSSENALVTVEPWEAGLTITGQVKTVAGASDVPKRLSFSGKARSATVMERG